MSLSISALKLRIEGFYSTNKTAVQKHVITCLDDCRMWIDFMNPISVYHGLREESTYKIIRQNTEELTGYCVTIKSVDDLIWSVHFEKDEVVT